MWLNFEWILLFLILGTTTITSTIGQSVTFFENYFAEGKKLHFPILHGCTPVPRNWENRISSLDTHNNCLVVYDTPFCKGRFLQVKLKYDEPRIIPQLNRLNWNDAIKSVKPCQIKHLLPPGRYQIQNVGNKMYLTIRNFQLMGWPTLDPIAQQKGYRRFFQQWEIKENPERTGNYFHISSRSLTGSPFRQGKDADPKDLELWDLVHIFGDVSLIRNKETKECLGMKTNGEIFQNRCNSGSTKQQWMFRHPDL